MEKKLKIFHPKIKGDFSGSASGSLYESSTFIASNKKSLHSYDPILFNQINVIGTEWYCTISRSSGDAISVKLWLRGTQ